MDDYFFFGDVGIQRTATPGTMWVVPGTQPIGEGFGDFTIGHEGAEVEVLGAGNTFGPVLAATLADGREVAVKLFLPIKPEYDRALLYDYAAHEFRRASQDLGPRFMRAYALFETQDHQGRAAFVMVMQRISGQQLDIATRTRRVADLTQVRLTRQMLEALGSLETHDIIWQDIKPANIMLDSDDLDRANLVFIDHGSTRKLGAGTHVNSQYTEAFAAPETLVLSVDATQRVFTHASDIFSAGVTLLSAFTMGHPYLDDASEYRTLNATPNLSSPMLADQVEETLAGMLVRNPAHRASLSDLRAVLGGRVPQGWSPDPYRAYDDLPPTTPDEPVRNVRQQFKAIDSEASRIAQPVPSPTRSFDAAPAVDLVPLMPVEKPPAQESWLLEWAGVDSRWVREPTERKIYGAIGVALLVYFVYVCLGAAAVGWQSTESVAAAVIGGLLIGPLLGIALVNFDRTIVASVSPDLTNLADGEAHDPIKKTKGFWAGLWFRVFVAVVAAFIIGEAINVQLHSADVADTIGKMRLTEVAARKDTIDKNFESSLVALAVEVKTATEIRDTASGDEAKYLQLAADESAGNGATKKATCGTECKKFLRQAEAAKNKWETTKESLNQAVIDAEAAVKAKEAEVLTKKQEAETEIDRKVAGPMARSHALIQLALSDWLTGVKYVALIILFMAIELTAILIKLLTLGSTYERDMARRQRLHEYASQKAAGVRHFHVNEAAQLNKQLTRDLVWIQGAERAAAIDRRARVLARDLGVEAPPSAMTRSPR